MMTFDEMLPVIFMVVMGLAMLTYVVLDGYDLGIISVVFIVLQIIFFTTVLSHSGSTT